MIIYLNSKKFKKENKIYADILIDILSYFVVEFPFTEYNRKNYSKVFEEISRLVKMFLIRKDPSTKKLIYNITRFITFYEKMVDRSSLLYINRKEYGEITSLICNYKILILKNVMDKCIDKLLLVDSNALNDMVFLLRDKLNSNYYYTANRLKSYDAEDDKTIDLLLNLLNKIKNKYSNNLSLCSKLKLELIQPEDFEKESDGTIEDLFDKVYKEENFPVHFFLNMSYRKFKISTEFIERHKDEIQWDKISYMSCAGVNYTSTSFINKNIHLIPDNELLEICNWEMEALPTLKLRNMIYDEMLKRHPCDTKMHLDLLNKIDKHKERNKQMLEFRKKRRK